MTELEHKSFTEMKFTNPRSIHHCNENISFCQKLCRTLQKKRRNTNALEKNAAVIANVESSDALAFLMRTKCNVFPADDDGDELTCFCRVNFISLRFFLPFNDRFGNAVFKVRSVPTQFDFFHEQIIAIKGSQQIFCYFFRFQNSSLFCDAT